MCGFGAVSNTALAMLSENSRKESYNGTGKGTLHLNFLLKASCIFFSTFGGSDWTGLF